MEKDDLCFLIKTAEEANRPEDMLIYTRKV